MALRHVVMFRFRPDVTEEQRARLAEELRRLPAAIPEIAAYTVGTDAGLAEGNWDLPSSATSPRRRTGRPTGEHPVHQAVIADHVRPLVAERGNPDSHSLTRWPPGAGAPCEYLRSVDAQLARQLFAASLEVVECDLPVVESGVQVGELGQDRGLVGLGRMARTVVGVVTLLGLALPAAPAWPVLWPACRGLAAACRRSYAAGTRWLRPP